MPDATLYLRRELASRPEVTSLLGSGDGWDTWIWRWKAQEHVEGTGKVALVIAAPKGWAAPTRGHTNEFPQVLLTVFADRSRDAQGRPLRDDAEERALGVCGLLRWLLHNAGGKEQWWGDDNGRTRVVSSVVDSEPELISLPDTDGVVSARLRMNVVLG